jgi:tetratricopeptide (TPR) repeat protein
MLLERWQQPEHEEAYAQITRRLAEFYFERGKARYEAKEYEAALADLSEAVTLYPTGLTYHYGRGRTYYRLERYEDAVIDFAHDIEQRPYGGGEDDNYGWRGLAYYRLSKYTLALDSLSLALQFHLDDNSNYYWRGRVYQDMQDYPAALADFSRAIELQPENGNRYY